MRERQCNLFVGAPGRGKSTGLAKVLDNCNEQNILIYKHALNLNDAALLKYPVVKFDKYCGGRAKISSMDIPYKEFIERALAQYRNGALVIDDAQLYERDVVSKALNDLVIMRRHVSIDVYLIYHGCSILPIQLFPFINNMFLWHTADNFDYKAKKLPNFEMITAAKNRITRIAANAQPKTAPFYYCERILLS